MVWTEDPKSYNILVEQSSWNLESDDLTIIPNLRAPPVPMAAGLSEDRISVVVANVPIQRWREEDDDEDPLRPESLVGDIVREALAMGAGIPISAISRIEVMARPEEYALAGRASHFNRNYRCRVFLSSKESADKLLAVGKVTCFDRLLQIEEGHSGPVICMKCYEVSHVASGCDKRKPECRCANCGEKGHFKLDPVQGACQAQQACGTCKANGKSGEDVNHKSACNACPFFNEKRKFLIREK